MRMISLQILSIHKYQRILLLKIFLSLLKILFEKNNNDSLRSNQSC